MNGLGVTQVQLAERVIRVQGRYDFFVGNGMVYATGVQAVVFQSNIVIMIYGIDSINPVCPASSNF